MNEDKVKQMRREAEDIFRHSVDAVDPHGAVKRFVRMEGDQLVLGSGAGDPLTLDTTDYQRIALVGGGKATAPMAKALEEILGDRLETGLIVVKYGFGEPLSRTEIIEAGHPLPDENSLSGTQKILDFLENSGEKDLIFSLISGGGSALLSRPAGDIQLSDLQALTGSLLQCGASIDEMNALRKHISLCKGGQMARAAHPATVVNLMLSDVVGDRMDVIASGPFVPDTSTFGDAVEVIRKYGLKDVPEPILSYLESGASGETPETPKTGEAVFERIFNFIVGSNMAALEAAAKKAEALGYASLILSSMLEGETRDAARFHTAIAREMVKSGRPVPPPACILTGGETTVTIRGSGLGGRNQEFCLAAALDLAGQPPRVVILSGGTDGNDGPTDAAGAVIDPFTIERGEAARVSAVDSLNQNDAYHFFEKTGELLFTGPTRTNVMDVHVILVR